MFHVKPFVQFSLRVEPELAEVLAAVAADAGVKPGKMLNRMVAEVLGKRRGELLLSARVGPPVGTRKDRLKYAWDDLKADTREAFRAGLDAAGVDEEPVQVLPPPLEETTEDSEILGDRIAASEHIGRDCPATVGAYRCQLQKGHADVHEWGR